MERQMERDGKIQKDGETWRRSDGERDGERVMEIEMEREMERE